ncbi:MAG: hypothetical protein GTN78_20215, partial [Gemmatimonadales bacterium]|nr:hypothetical protein [Gemmatimonadales bacterium]
MSIKRRRGFAPVDLLVVTAIDGILGAMLFSVPARARESAREAVCFSDVKSIAPAIQMYPADNDDALVPSEYRPEAVEYLASSPRVGSGYWMGDGRRGLRHHRDIQASPYLRWP